MYVCDVVKRECVLNNYVTLLVVVRVRHTVLEYQTVRSNNARISRARGSYGLEHEYANGYIRLFSENHHRKVSTMSSSIVFFVLMHRARKQQQQQQQQRRRRRQQQRADDDDDDDDDDDIAMYVRASSRVDHICARLLRPRPNAAAVARALAAAPASRE